MDHMTTEAQLWRGVPSNQGESYRPLLQRPHTGGYQGAGSGTPWWNVDKEAGLFFGEEVRPLGRASNPVRDASTRWAQPLPAYGNPQHPDRIIMPGVRGGLWDRGNNPWVRQLSLQGRWGSDNDPAVRGSGVKTLAGFTGGVEDLREYWRGQTGAL
jgi:hypothetical protein